MIRFVFTILAAVFCLSFLNLTQEIDPERQKKIEAEIQNRIADYRLEKRKDCLQKILTEAEIYVDSLLAVELSPLLSDTSKIPPRPSRPFFELRDSL